MISIYIHIEGLESALVDVEELPKPEDSLIVCRNPRRRDGKDLSYLLPDVNMMLLPINRVTFIEVFSEAEEDDIETFIRE